MQIPVYVVTGFLDAGKTTFLNEMIKRLPEKREALVVQFESGDEEIDLQNTSSRLFAFSKKQWTESEEDIRKKLKQEIETNPPDEIWIEHNGVTECQKLFELLSSLSMSRISLKIQKIVHMIDYQIFRQIIGKTGGAMLEQIANSDMAVVHGVKTSEEIQKLKSLLRNLNTQIAVWQADQTEAIYEEIYRKKTSDLQKLLWLGTGLAGTFLTLWRFMDTQDARFNTILNVFLGIAFQALPFLLIGVLISSFIQVFISRETIERLFPKKVLTGILTAILAGFFLPVCDCASIPIFRSLVRKRVPLPAAVSFMVATPVINPVVILSTYYAFNGSLRIVMTRVVLGILSAVLIGLFFHFYPSASTEVAIGNSELALCSCGCYEQAGEVESFRGKFRLWIAHAQIEFFNVGKYLMIGAFVTAMLQTMLSTSFSNRSSADFALSIVVMMLMAFLLSLCSSSDAVIAKSLANRFPLASTMGFLVFGPMMDVKNIILLSGYFPKKFILKLFVVTAVMSFLMVFLLSKLLLGV